MSKKKVVNPDKSRVGKKLLKPSKGSWAERSKNSDFDLFKIFGDAMNPVKGKRK